MCKGFSVVVAWAVFLGHWRFSLAMRLTTVSLGMHNMQVYSESMYRIIKTHGSESRGQGGSSKRRPNGLETHTLEYYTRTRVVKFENAITEET